ncbi:hypothetical protein EDB85DRAFT_1900481 [Lactarius pseudohatsudake]|nr:hypothetical protein EDB85DRAFT_1900481 [Lactarius pseudohatsudake]
MRRVRFANAARECGRLGDARELQYQDGQTPVLYEHKCQLLTCYKNKIHLPLATERLRSRAAISEGATLHRTGSKLSQEAEELDKQNKLALAEMELNEEAQDAVEECMAVRHLADLRYSEKEDQAEPRDDVLEERPVDEDGPQDENDEPPHSEDECLEPETMPKAQGKKKKLAKGEMRKAVEAMTAVLRQAREETLVSKRPGANNKT